MKAEDKPFIHPTAIVEENVSMGERSKVWHHCHVRKGSILGDDVSLGKGVFVDQDVRIGNGSRIQNGVSVYHGVRVMEWVFVGPNVTFTNDRFPRAGSKAWKLSETILKPGCSIGAGCIITCDLTIGGFALIGAGTIVTESVPPFTLVYGVPSRVVSKICACGTTKFPLTDPSKDYIRPCCFTNLRDEVITLAKEQLKEMT